MLPNTRNILAVVHREKHPNSAVLRLVPSHVSTWANRWVHPDSIRSKTDEDHNTSSVLHNGPPVEDAQ
jgi:hypothetical protein